jgi:UDP-glucose:(heptosyl)LPS alpha-1,3-glucosyltransferase
VQAGSIEANSRRFSGALARRLYVLSKQLNPRYSIFRAIERRQYAPVRKARVVAVSNMVKRHLERFHHVPRQRIYVIPNAIDPQRVKVSQPGAVRCALRNQLGLEPADLVGLFAGHNLALKGLRPLLRALAARNRPAARPIHLLVCGGGHAVPVRRLARSLGITQSVHFLGFHSDIRECYAASDFFVLPTYYDPCSLAVLEALACGLPVITTLQNGAGELMTQGRQGYLLTTPDAREELVAALDRMASDSLRAAMSAEAARLGREQTFDRHASALIKVFEEVAASRNNHGSHGRLGGTRPHGESRWPAGRKASRQDQ